MLTIGHVRAVVFADRVYLLALSQQSKDYARSLAAHLRHIYGASRPAAMLVGGRRPASVVMAPPSSTEDPSELDAPPHELYERLLLRQQLQLNTATGIPDAAASISADFPLADAETQDALDRAAAAAQFSDSSTSTFSRPEDATGLEFVVLEHALLTVQGRHARRVAYVRKLLDTLIGRVGTAERDDGRLYALFPLANTLTHYEMVSRGLCECIRALLDDDRDMREACLSEKARLSQRVTDAVVDTARSQASAYDPHSTAIQSAPNRAGYALEGADAYLGQTVSPIGSHAQVLRILQSNPHSSDALLGGRRDGEAWQTTAPHNHVDEPADEDSHRWRAAVSSPGATALPRPRLATEEDDDTIVGLRPGRGSILGSSASAGTVVSGRATNASDADNSWDASVPPILRINAEILSQLELMLESCLHRCTETSTHVIEMSRSLTSKQNLLELQGSQQRNHILGLSLRISVISASISCATFITSLFGMNLISGMENTPGAFAATAAATAVLGATVYRAFDGLVASGATTAQARRLELMDDILRRLDANILVAKTVVERAAAQAHLLDGKDTAAAAGRLASTSSAFKGLTKIEFRRLFSEQIAASSEKHMTAEETDLLFDLLDANGDGRLRPEEVSMIPRGGWTKQRQTQSTRYGSPLCTGGRAC